MTTDRPHPQPGDICACCDHAPNPYGVHLFQVNRKFQKTSGAIVRVLWVFICDACFKKYVVELDGLATDAPIKKCFTWTENMTQLTYREPS